MHPKKPDQAGSTDWTARSVEFISWKFNRCCPQLFSMSQHNYYEFYMISTESDPKCCKPLQKVPLDNAGGEKCLGFFLPPSSTQQRWKTWRATKEILLFMRLLKDDTNLMAHNQSKITVPLQSRFNEELFYCLSMYKTHFPHSSHLPACFMPIQWDIYQNSE